VAPAPSKGHPQHPNLLVAADFKTTKEENYGSEREIYGNF